MCFGVTPRIHVFSSLLVSPHAILSASLSVALPAVKVYGPVAMYCDVVDPACAAMIEKAIPTKKLYGKPH